MQSAYDLIKARVDTNKMFTMEEISELTGARIRTVQETLAKMQNKRYCRINEDPITLVTVTRGKEKLCGTEKAFQIYCQQVASESI